MGAKDKVVGERSPPVAGRELWQAARMENVETQSQMLRGSELSYRRLFEAARDGILILEFDTGRVSDVNPFLADLLGFSHGEMVGKTVGELSPFRDLVANQRVLERLQKDGYVRHDDLPLETRDGRRIAVEFVSNVYQAGDVKVIQCNIRDITERKRAEAELRWKTAFLEAQVNSSLDGILVVDNQGKQILQNQRLSDLWKIPPHIAGDKDDAVQMEFVTNRMKHPRQFAAKVAHLYSHPDEVSRDEIELIDGTILDRYSSPVRGNNGKYYGRIWTFRDITERKRAEDSHARLAMAVEQAAETVMITDTHGTILYVNPAFEKSTGYTRAEALGQNPRILKSGKQDAEFYARMWDVLKRGEVWQGHFINKRKDGKFYEEEATISPVRDAAGTIVNYVAVKRDVTREVQLESQFRQAQKMEAIGTLAGGVAHDFNNILAVIQLQAGLLKSSGGLSAAQSSMTDDVGIAVERGAALTRQLLLFSRREVFQPRDLDLSVSITNTTKMLRRILGETIKVQLTLAGQPMWIHADAGMMDQVLMNLAVNARDAMLNGGQLVIETSAIEFDELAVSQSAQARPGPFVCLSVSDNGGGIPPEILPRVFEPFFTTKSVGKGTGLGLATVFGIVQQHQGWIHVYSEVGRGTTFRIYLPRLVRRAGAKSSAAAPTAVRGGNETILLVEDELSLRVSVRMTLSRLGYRILEAPTGVKALEVWKENHDEIRLLLTDLVMPDGMTGIDLAQRLLQDNSELKVIYMSGYSAEVAGREFPMQEGVNFLSKPFESPKLAQTIRDNLDRHA